MTTNLNAHQQSRNTKISLPCRVIETDKHTVYIEFQKGHHLHKTWLPKANVNFDNTRKTNVPGKGEILQIRLPKWLAHVKGMI